MCLANSSQNQGKEIKEGTMLAVVKYEVFRTCGLLSDTLHKFISTDFC